MYLSDGLLLALWCIGEDPYLTSVYAREIIRAMQGGFGPGGGNASARYYKTITTPKVSYVPNCPMQAFRCPLLAIKPVSTLRRFHACYPVGFVALRRPDL